MAKVTCGKCKVEFEYSPGGGRPRKYCDGCRRVDARRGRSTYAPRPRGVRHCLSCGDELTGSKSARYCSGQCKWKARKAREGIPCDVCGEPTGWTRRSGKSNVTHKRCSRQPCGTVGSYRRHLKHGEEPCQPCRDAAAEEMREYAVRRKERDGVSLYSQNRKYDGAHGHFIPRVERLAIYERDEWTCQLCLGAVDLSLYFNDRMAATLDHIEPQSAALIADHRPENLRLAHRACNSRRSNG